MYAARAAIFFGSDIALLFDYNWRDTVRSVIDFERGTPSVS